LKNTAATLNEMKETDLLNGVWKIFALSSLTALNILRTQWEMLPATFVDMGNHLD
jgi:hypothetical protein